MCSFKKKKKKTRYYSTISEESEWAGVGAMRSLTGFLLWWPWMVFTRKNLLDFITGLGFSPTLCLISLMCVCKFLLGKWSGFLYPLIVFACGFLWSAEGGRSGGVSPTLRIQGFGWPLPSPSRRRGWAQWTGLVNSEAWCKRLRSKVSTGILRCVQSSPVTLTNQTTLGNTMGHAQKPLGLPVLVL